MGGKIRELTDTRARARCDAGRVRIEILLDATDPPVGRVGHDGAQVAFRGWIDLLAVLSDVLEASRHEHGELGPGPKAELGQDV